MNRDLISPISGTNGETDGTDWAKTERRWRTPAPEERIGDVRFSLWKTDAPLKATAHRFSPTFFVVTITASVGLIALGVWTANRIRQGDFLAGKIFFVGFLLATYGSALIAVVLNRRARRSVGEAVPPPEGVPPSAIACHVRVSRRGRCVGWLWFEGDLMVFRGAGFDFHLRREDFRNRSPLLKAFRNDLGALLRGPKGVSEYNLLLTPGVISGETFRSDRSIWRTIEADFAAWESGSFSREPSLFPPIRPVSVAPFRFRWTTFVVPSLLMASLLGFARLVLPVEPVNGRPPVPAWQFALVGALFGLVWPFMLWTEGKAKAAFAREADRAAARAG